MKTSVFPLQDNWNVMEIQLIFSGRSCRAPIICALELLLEVKLHTEEPIKRYFNPCVQYAPDNSVRIKFFSF